MGARPRAPQVVDHHDLVAQVRSVAPDGVNYIFSTHTGGNIGNFAEIIQPFGAITAIDEPEGPDLLPLKEKASPFTGRTCSPGRCSGPRT